MDAADTVGRTARTARTSPHTAGGPMPGTHPIYKFPFREFGSRTSLPRDAGRNPP